VKKRNPVEQSKREMGMRLRAEASILRDRYLNEVLPAAEDAFDRQFTAGESVTLVLPSVDDIIDEAVRQLESDLAVLNEV